ncbi:hypothetical protein L1887_34301 [Cichorium endivia]|nr:hypothetical protein L1887_34301 [Cichorium endivia]
MAAQAILQSFRLQQRSRSSKTPPPLQQPTGATTIAAAHRRHHRRISTSPGPPSSQQPPTIPRQLQLKWTDLLSLSTSRLELVTLTSDFRS